VARKHRRSHENRRQAVAGEAARLMQDQGLRDFRSAKAKAVDRLGLERSGALPGNREIERALAEHQRIFAGDEQEEVLLVLRRRALQLMELLEEFGPRLVGDALSGLANDHSPLELHLFADAPEQVADTLSAHGLRHRSTARRYRLRHGVTESFPAFSCLLPDCDCILTVFPLRQRGHAPLSPVDGRPMRRAGTRQVAALAGLKA
jgi:hypothetical protein